MGRRLLPLLLLLAAAAGAARPTRAASPRGAAAAAAGAGRWIGEHLPAPSLVGDVAAPEVHEDISGPPMGSGNDNRPDHPHATVEDNKALLRAAYEKTLSGLSATRASAARTGAGAGAAAGSALDALGAAEARLREWGRALLAAPARAGHRITHPTEPSASGQRTAPGPASAPALDDTPPQTVTGPTLIPAMDPVAAAAAEAAHHQAGVEALRVVVVSVGGLLTPEAAQQLPHACGACEGAEGGTDASGSACDARAEVLACMERLAAALALDVTQQEASGQ
ncbi:hypothetical protein MNEG_11601, partial [Monoraphidium neglectum]